MSPLTRVVFTKENMFGFELKQEPERCPPREGSNQYEKAFGVKSEDLFEALYR